MTEKNKKSFWGFGITIFYSVFIVFILALVMFVSLQDIELVAEDYYHQDQLYQQQIDRIRRTIDDKMTPLYSYDQVSNSLEINFPQRMTSEISQGEITLFRPSNANLDYKLPLAIDSSSKQIVDMSNMASGLWKLYIEWKVDSVEYYTEEMIVVR